MKRMNGFRRFVLSALGLAVFLGFSAEAALAATCPALPTITQTGPTNGNLHFHVNENSCDPGGTYFWYAFVDAAGNCAGMNGNEPPCRSGNGIGPLPAADFDFSACNPPGPYRLIFDCQCLGNSESGGSCNGLAPRPHVEYPFTFLAPSLSVPSHITPDKLLVNYNYGGAASTSMSYTLDGGPAHSVTDPACLQPSGSCTVTLGVGCGNGVVHNVALSVTGCTTQTTNQSFRVECTDAECGPRN